MLTTDDELQKSGIYLIFVFALFFRILSLMRV